MRIDGFTTEAQRAQRFTEKANNSCYSCAVLCDLCASVVNNQGE
jgi:hypothetical protein